MRLLSVTTSFFSLVLVLLYISITGLTGPKLSLLGMLGLVSLLSSSWIGITEDPRFFALAFLGLAALTFAAGFSIFANVTAQEFALKPDIPWWGGFGCRKLGICISKQAAGSGVGLFLALGFITATLLSLLRIFRTARGLGGNLPPAR